MKVSRVLLYAEINQLLWSTPSTRFLLQRLSATPPNDQKDDHYRQRTRHDSNQRYSIHQFAPLGSI